jgi:large subunit ribosomal protein L26e
MKLNKNVTSSRRKARKAHFSATSVERRERMCAPLSSALKMKYKVNAMPIRVDDEVKVLRGASDGRGKDGHKGVKGKEGKVVAVVRKKYAIHVERCERDNVKGKAVFIPIDPSNVVITSLKMDRNRRDILTRRALASDKTGGASGNKMTTVD